MYSFILWLRRNNDALTGFGILFNVVVAATALAVSYRRPSPSSMADNSHGLDDYPLTDPVLDYGRNCHAYTPLSNLSLS